MHAYDKLYLEKAQIALGSMLDYAVYDLQYEAERFWELFIASGYADRFGDGDCALTVGKSGVELTRMIIETASGETITTKPHYTADRSPEYWAGWALAYYQWFSGLSFREIQEIVSVGEVVDLYSPYHEMDIRQFCDKMTGLCRKRRPETNLKRLRKTLDITQKELAEQSGVPLRTLQQYEQRQKDINKAQAEYLIALSKVLSCPPEALIEKI